MACKISHTCVLQSAKFLLWETFRAHGLVLSCLLKIGWLTETNDSSYLVILVVVLVLVVVVVVVVVVAVVIVVN